MNSRAVRVVAKSPSELSAKDVQSESRPKNQANPGRWLDAGSSISSNQPGSQVRVRDQTLKCADPGPVICVLELGIRELQADCSIEILPVILSRTFEQLCKSRTQMIVCR